MNLKRTIIKLKNTCKVIRLVGAESEAFFPTLLRIRALHNDGDLSIQFLFNSDWIRHPETYLANNEYIEKCLRICDRALGEALYDKQVLFKRMPELMGRAYLDVQQSTEEEIHRFIAEYKKVIAKCNQSGGANMFLLTEADRDIMGILKRKKTTILEEFIQQHPAYAAINASSVNTLRIHTVRTTEGCRAFLYPKLRAGRDGMISDLVSEKGTAYRILLDHEGRILCAGLNGRPCSEHEDTGYLFTPGRQLPFVPEAESLCVKAAERMPESRYIGWDVAITEGGPRIVEANLISGAMEMYQLLCYQHFGNGNGREIREMLDAAMEGIDGKDDYSHKAVSFADLSYLRKGDATPDALQKYLILLQSTLLNYGVEFYQVTEKDADCDITYNPEKRSMVLRKAEEKAFALPSRIPEDLYEADLSARALAKVMYEELERMR